MADGRPMYSLFHGNVDGAGHLQDFDTLEAAQAEADRLQAESDGGGNPWGYRYSVFTGIDRWLRLQDVPGRGQGPMRRFEAVELPAGWTVRDRQEELVAVPRSSWPEGTAAMVAGALTNLPAYAVAFRWAPSPAGGGGR